MEFTVLKGHMNPMIPLALIVCATYGILFGIEVVGAQSVQIDPNAANCLERLCIRSKPLGPNCAGRVTSVQKPTLFCGVTLRTWSVPGVGRIGIPSYKSGRFHIYRTPDVLSGKCVEVSIFRSCV